MATRIEPFEVLTPANTAEASYLVTALPFQDGQVERVEILVPPGPSGLMGFKLAHSGQSVIPLSGSQWNIADNARFDWPLHSFPTGNAWELWTYNTDVFEHTIYIWFHVLELDFGIIAPAQPLSISPGGDSTHADVLDLAG